MNLKELSPEHELRNKPLAEIGAEYKWTGTTAWKTVTDAYRIAKKTFNDLGEAWTHNTDWRSAEK